jgi:hypothetical protein
MSDLAAPIIAPARDDQIAASARKHADRLASLDLSRGLAALAMMVPHFFLYVGWQTGVPEIMSATAVEVFFVPSGFVLGPQVLMCLARSDLRTYRIFLLRRWMRTIPPYLVAALRRQRPNPADRQGLSRCRIRSRSRPARRRRGSKRRRCPSRAVGTSDPSRHVARQIVQRMRLMRWAAH